MNRLSFKLIGCSEMDEPNTFLTLMYKSDSTIMVRYSSLKFDKVRKGDTSMKSYEETMNDFQEAVSLGYSAKEVMNMFELDFEANEEALKELNNTLKYGI